MLRFSIILLVLGLTAMIMGFFTIGGITFETGRILLFLFLTPAVLGFILGSFRGFGTSPNPGVSPIVSS